MKRIIHSQDEISIYSINEGYIFISQENPGGEDDRISVHISNLETLIQSLIDEKKAIEKAIEG